MSMIDLKIDTLSIQFTGAAGHEHRIRPISTRAAAILAERLDERFARIPEAQRQLDRLRGPKVDLDLRRMSDERAAQKIAESWLDALALQMR